MKKILFLSVIATIIILSSCQKHELSYLKDDINLATSAEVRIIYDIPVTGSANNITRLKINDMLASEVSTVLGSIFPNSVAKYFVIPQGQVKIETFTGTTKDVLQYSKTFTVTAGKKHSVYIYDLTQPPLVIQDADVFPDTDPFADTVCFIQFVNLLYKADGTPYGKLFLKGRRGSGTTASPYVYSDVAQCDFKEASALIPYRLKIVSVSGIESSMTWVLFNQDGTMLKYYPSSSGALTDYTSTGNSATKGRGLVFHLNGKLGTNYAGQIIRLSSFSLK